MPNLFLPSLDICKRLIFFQFIIKVFLFLADKNGKVKYIQIGGNGMSTLPVQIHEVIRFYDRVNKLKPDRSGDRGRTGGPDMLNISAEAKKRLVREQARSAVLERIKK
jgi:hypothetical protein